MSPSSAAGAEAPSTGLRRVYVWDALVRSTHWLIALSFFVLSATGFYIGRPFLVVTGRARDHFVTGYFKTVHFYAAIVFALALASRLLWLFIGSPNARLRRFLPVTKESRRRMREVLSFYLFVRRRPPREFGHNPLAGITYCFVWLLCGVMVLTGLGLYAMHDDPISPVSRLAFLLRIFGGAARARQIHHTTMWLLWGFFAHHLFSAYDMESEQKNGLFQSIITGYKWAGPDDEVR